MKKITKNERYRLCINAMYNEAKSSGSYFTNQKQFCQEFGVSPHITKALYSIGAIRTIGGTRQKKYFWIGEAPTDYMIKQVMKSIQCFTNQKDVKSVDNHAFRFKKRRLKPLDEIVDNLLNVTLYAGESNISKDEFRSLIRTIINY